MAPLEHLAAPLPKQSPAEGATVSTTPATSKLIPAPQTGLSEEINTQTFNIFSAQVQFDDPEIECQEKMIKEKKENAADNKAIEANKKGQLKRIRKIRVYEETWDAK